MTNYIFSTEIGCFIILSFFLFMMLYTRPNRTILFRLDFLGVCQAMVAIILEYIIGYSVTKSVDGSVVHRGVFYFAGIAFILVYIMLLCDIVLYITQLAQKKDKTKNWVRVVNVVMLSVYFSAGVYHILTGKLFHYNENGAIVITNLVKYCLVFGIIGALFSIIVSIRNRKEIPPTVFNFIMIFVPIDLALLVFQYLNPEHIFTAVTYSFPYIIFYVVFHSNPYDDITGTQNAAAFNARYLECVKRHKKFMVVFVDIPQLENVDFENLTDNHDRMIAMFASTCRRVENQHRGIKIYRTGSNTFAILFYYKDLSAAIAAAEKVHAIVDGQAKSMGGSIVVKTMAFSGGSKYGTLQFLRCVRHYMLEKTSVVSGSCFICANEEDFQKIEYHYQVEQLLLDIRNHHDLDDERVLVYTQPIFSVKENRFKTAEALMRLTLDGKMVFPDVFIPLAEENQCIHALSMIILNKVCAQAKALKDEYDFDAITVNFSSSEFSDPFLYEEVLDIIDKNEVSPSYVRIELTESAIFDNFDIVRLNMDKMKSFGIKFYLDDYGTGYSNLERIMECPFNTIKFDKSLLYKAIADSGMNAIMSETIKVFREKGYEALVEGVEDEAQREYSVEHGFQFIQGYHFAKPQPIEQLKEFFTKK